MLDRALTRRTQTVPVLLALAGWTLAGIMIVTSSLLGWPPTSSLVLQVPGWEYATIGTGTALTAGGALTIASASSRLKLSTRWRVETSGLWLLAVAWAGYGLLSLPSRSAAVVIIMAGHVAGALWRLRELRREEHLVRAVIEGRRR